MKNKLYKIYISILTIGVFTSCTTQKNIASKRFDLGMLIDTSAIIKNSLVGLYIIDAKTQEVIFEKNADKYFIPASNAKIFTLYGCLKTLSDSLPALRYISQNDSTIIWGTGDPTFLHPDFATSNTWAFLKSRPNLYFSNSNFKNEALGPGWSWDDYNDYYQTEISPLPMYGNIVRNRVLNQKLSINPKYFTQFYTQNGFDYLKNIKREISANKFSYSAKILNQINYKQDIPFITSEVQTIDLLKDTLHKNVQLINLNMPKNAKTLYAMPIDTVLRKMMLDSDNMLAEQLLLLAGGSDTLSSIKAIKKITQQYLQYLPQKNNWVDGSGMSRYNLMSPNNLVKILDNLIKEYPLKRVFSLMSIGGVSGTLKKQFKGEEPYVFAKTGSMSGVYNQSGYMKTKSGRLLIFSFMNNNFNTSILKIRDNTVEILAEIHKNL